MSVKVSSLDMCPFEECTPLDADPVLDDNVRTDCNVGPDPAVGANLGRRILRKEIGLECYWLNYWHTADFIDTKTRIVIFIFCPMHSDACTHTCFIMVKYQGLLKQGRNSCRGKRYVGTCMKG